jgi:hypothetical protein
MAPLRLAQHREVFHSLLLTLEMIRLMAGLRGSMGGTGIELVPPSHAVAGSGDSCHLADDRGHGVYRRAPSGCHLNAA